VIQLLARALTGEGSGSGQHQAVELVGIDERQPSQHAGVDPIAFGVALIGAAEIGDLLTIDQIDRNRLACILHGDGKPGHASRFDHNLHLVRGCAVTRLREQVRELAGTGVEGQDRGAEMPALVQNHRFMGGLDG